MQLLNNIYIYLFKKIKHLAEGGNKKSVKNDRHLKQNTKNLMMESKHVENIVLLHVFSSGSSEYKFPMAVTKDIQYTYL